MTNFISVSSRDQTYGNNSDFRVQFKHPIRDVKKIRVSEVNIPVTYYTVMSGINDKIYFTETSAYVATLTEGVYSITDYLALVKAAMDTAYTPDNNFTCALVSDSSKKIIISHASASFSLTFATNTTASAASTLGYLEVDTSSTTSHTATNIYDLGYNKEIFVHSHVLGAGNGVVGGFKSNVIYIAKIKVDYGGQITYENGNTEDWAVSYGNSKDISEIDLKLTFEDRKTVVPLNGHNWRITMTYETKK